jgi:hypothetical protein
MRLDPPANVVSQLSHWTFLQLPPDTGARAVTPFEWRFSFFLNRSVGQKTGNLIA